MERPGISQPYNGLSTGISVIIPSWDYGVEISRLARAWARFAGVHEVIVCTIETSAVPNSKESDPSVNVCRSDKIGRGFQMNRGAELATGDVLLFHHADSVLTEAHANSITREMNDLKTVGGAFYRKFDERHPHLRWLEGPERVHSRLFGTLYGDQSIFVRHSHFKRLGGFAKIPLMEDVEFSKRLRRSGNVALLDPPMQTSPRKHQLEGAWKVTLQNLLFLILFKCGANPGGLHRWYYSKELKMRERTETISSRGQPDHGLQSDI